MFGGFGGSGGGYAPPRNAINQQLSGYGGGPQGNAMEESPGQRMVNAKNQSGYGPLVEGAMMQKEGPFWPLKANMGGEEEVGNSLNEALEEAGATINHTTMHPHLNESVTRVSEIPRVDRRLGPTGIDGEYGKSFSKQSVFEAGNTSLIPGPIVFDPNLDGMKSLPKKDFGGGDRFVWNDGQTALAKLLDIGRGVDRVGEWLTTQPTFQHSKDPRAIEGNKGSGIFHAAIDLGDPAYSMYSMVGGPNDYRGSIAAGMSGNEVPLSDPQPRIINNYAKVIDMIDRMQPAWGARKQFSNNEIGLLAELANE